MKQIHVSTITPLHQKEEYVLIEKWLLEEGDIPTFDLFELSLYGEEKHLFHPKGKVIDAAVSQKLSLLHHVYIQRDDLVKYYNFISLIVQAIAKNEHISITKKAAIVYRQASATLDEMFQNPEALENVPKSKKVVNDFVNTIFGDEHAIESMIKITAYDYYTQTHSINVCVYALSLGSYLKFDPKMLEELGMAALLHDLGKSKVDSKITNKAGPLTFDEFEQMKHHPAYGHAIALKIGVKDPLILDGIRHHHEKLDGSGYPDGMRGEQITVFARIIAVCDVFDALTTKRSYKPCMRSYEALLLMKAKMEGHLDLRYITAFIEMQRHG